MVSPSRLTLIPSYPSFPLSDVWLDLNSFEEDNALPNSTLETPAPQSFRCFGPEDFTNLQDHMFEDKLLDSESEIDDE